MQPITRTVLKVDLTITPDFQVGGQGGELGCWVHQSRTCSPHCAMGLGGVAWALDLACKGLHALCIAPDSSPPQTTRPPALQWDEKIHGVVEPFWIMVEDSDSGEAALLLAGCEGGRALHAAGRAAAEWQ